MILIHGLQESPLNLMATQNKLSEIPVVDLFAGPGGLSEGFAAFKNRNRRNFKIVLSIEKDEHAHRTLRLRSFFRQFESKGCYPDAIIRFAQSGRTAIDEDVLFADHPKQYEIASTEALQWELGSPHFPESELDRMIRDCIDESGLWILIGGPPCQAYSLVGRARRAREDRLNFEKDQRHYLYKQYLRIIAEHAPPVFVMENVKGMLSSTIGGRKIVDQILDDLENPGGKEEVRYRLYPFVREGLFDRFEEPPAIGADRRYASEQFVIRCEEFGVPQARHRVIILGVRNDFPAAPKSLQSDEQVTVRDVMKDLPALRSSVSGQTDSADVWVDTLNDIFDFVDAQNTSSDVLKSIEKAVRSLDTSLPTGSSWFRYKPCRPTKFVKQWLRQNDLGGITNHEARRHMAGDLHRYLFAACFSEVMAKSGKSQSPKLGDFPTSLLPNHLNINPDDPGKSVFSDRFRVQIWDRFATTVTSHISKDGHYFIHPDPAQCRSLTVREAARLQTFPDDYVFLGTRTSQYQQVGNAVPPLLASKLASIVFDVFKRSV